MILDTQNLSTTPDSDGDRLREHDGRGGRADRSGRADRGGRNGPRERGERDGRGTRLRTAFIAVLVVGVALVPLSVATVAAQDGSTVRVTDTSLDPGGTATARVVLTSAPEGLAGFELVLSVDGEAATITGANYTDAFGLTTEPAVGEDGRTIRLEAADVDGDVGAGATDVALATVELRGESVGGARLDVRPVQFDADGGGPMDVGAEAGTVVVGSGSPTATATPPGTTDAPASEGSDAADGTTDSPEADGDGDGPTRTSTTTNGQGALPLAGVGLTALALVLLGALLARYR